MLIQLVIAVLLTVDHTLCMEFMLTYKYLDNVRYNVPLSNVLVDAAQFPRPPLIPPPPPSWNQDTNAILREAVFISINSHLTGQSFGWKYDDTRNPTKKALGIEDCRQYFMDSQSIVNRSEQNNKNNQVLKDFNGSAALLPQTGKAEADKTKIGPRGPRGAPGKDGAAGPPGPRGTDGLPGLVVFSSERAMSQVQLEGLLAYRSDVKQLFLRDNVSWRLIRTSRCGDGIMDKETGEQCDDGNDDIHDNCNGCRKSFCGDGIQNVNTEECDGRDFGGQSCATYRQGMMGSLLCLPNCIISHERCHRRSSPTI